MPRRSRTRRRWPWPRWASNRRQAGSSAQKSRGTRSGWRWSMAARTLSRGVMAVRPVGYLDSVDCAVVSSDETFTSDTRAATSSTSRCRKTPSSGLTAISARAKSTCVIRGKSGCYSDSRVGLPRASLRTGCSAVQARRGASPCSYHALMNSSRNHASPFRSTRTPR